jgi:tetratricopeptide (TPR) repeat protein
MTVDTHRHGARSLWPRAKLAALAIGLGVLTLAPGPARADLPVARDLFARGEYARARELLESEVKKGGRGQAHALAALARLQLDTGRWDEADAAATRLAALPAKGARETGTTLRAEVAFARGKLPEARSLLEGVLRRSPAEVRARALLGAVLVDSGDRTAADRVYDTFYQDYKHRRLDETRAETLWALAAALRFNEDYDEANKQLGAAEKVDPGFYEAFLLRGELFSEKYAVGYAELEYQDVLKKNPHHPRALVGMARVKLEQSYDVESALALLAKAESQNPRLVEVSMVRAEISIDNEDWGQAERDLGKALALDPSHLQARSLLCTALYLKGDTAGYERERRRVLGQDRHHSRLFTTIADFAAKHHRYTEAIALNKEAIKVNPKDYRALAALGINHLRHGDEPEGLKNLRRAFDGDQYNVRAFNTLNLFEDIFPKGYDVVQLGRFRMRLPRKQKALWSHLAPRLLERAYQDLYRRYGFHPKGPLTIELFGDAQHYAVRTVGLPGLGALGVCFGQLITARAPSPENRGGGRFNWEQILWHELSHIFSIQLSRSRVPRWFTEGLAEVETIRVRPEWDRDNDQDLYAAMVRGKLMHVNDLNLGFVRAKSTREIVVAYYQSALTVAFLEKRFGMPRVLEALRLFAQGRSTSEVIPRVTGMSIEQFEAAFRADLDRRLAHLKGSFVPPEVQLSGVSRSGLTVTDADDAKQGLEKLAAQARGKPSELDLQERLAVAQLALGQGEAAGKTAQAVLAQAPTRRVALYVAARAALQAREFAPALKHHQALIAQGADSYEIRMGAALAAYRLKDWKSAEVHLRRARRFDPQKGEPASRLADILEKNGRTDEALMELEAAVGVDQSDLASARKLVTGYRQKRQHDKVVKFAAKAIAIDPFDVDIHQALAESALEVNQPAEAVFAFESALALEPRAPAPLWAGLARAHLARGDRVRAREAVKKALLYDPQNAEAQKLAARVGR